MLYKTFQPKRGIAPYVSFYWALKAKVKDGEIQIDPRRPAIAATAVPPVLRTCGEINGG